MKNFDNHVSVLFFYLEKDFDYFVIKKRNDLIVYTNLKYNIHIYLEYANSFISIEDEEKKYEMGLLYFVVNNKTIEMYGDVKNIEQRVKLQLENYSSMLKKILGYITTGNYFWKEKYLKFYQNLHYIQYRMGSSFTFNHPIYKKFIHGDDSWKDDVEKW